MERPRTAFHDPLSRRNVSKTLGRAFDSPISLEGRQAKFSDLDSNRTDNDLRRDMPEFADPRRKGNKRKILPEEDREGEELIPK